MKYLHSVFEVGEGDQDGSAALHFGPLHHPDRGLEVDLPGDVEDVDDDVLDSADQRVPGLVLGSGDPVQDEIILFTNLKIVHLFLDVFNHTLGRLDFVLECEDAVAKLCKFVLHF